jgi:hypothetical protein
MPGIANRYFPFAAVAPSVQSMPSEPFALGVFRRLAAGAPAAAFTGLVRGGLVRDISALGTVNDLLADWDAAFGRLA